jgi:hypothetical protein
MMPSVRRGMLFVLGIGDLARCRFRIVILAREVSANEEVRETIRV